MPLTFVKTRGYKFIYIYEDLTHREHLKMAVEHTHRCEAKWIETVPVRSQIAGETLWEGEVAVFAVKHPEAKICYAWSELSGRLDSGDRFATALALAGVDSPLEAVKSIVLRK